LEPAVAEAGVIDFNRCVMCDADRAKRFRYAQRLSVAASSV